MLRVLKKNCVFLLLAVMTIGSLSGCSTLRRKFIRKNKNEKEPELYLELRDYPEAPSQDIYHSHFSFVKGWLAEVVLQLEGGSNNKRIRYSIDKSIESLLIIKNYLKPESKQEMDALYGEFYDLKARIYDPYVLDFKRDSILKQAKRLKRKFAKQFSYNKIKHFLK